MRHTPSGKEFTEIILTVFRLNGQLLRTGDDLVAELGITSSQWQVMGAIYESPATVAEIARKMGLARQSVLRTANLLIESGLCTYQTNPNHKRAQILCLTTQGQKVMTDVNKRQATWANDLAKRFRKNQLTEARELLDSMLGYLAEEEEK